MWIRRMRERGTVRRAEAKIGELVVLIARATYTCPLGTMQEVKEPSMLYAPMLWGISNMLQCIYAHRSSLHRAYIKA